MEGTYGSTRQNDYQVPSHYCRRGFIILKLFHLLTHQDLKPGGEVSSAAALKEGGAAATQKKGPISFILLAPPHREMAFFAQFWGVTLHLFWLMQAARVNPDLHTIHRWEDSQSNAQISTLAWERTEARSRVKHNFLRG